MNKVNYITLRAAHNFCTKEQGKKKTAYVKMSEIASLVHANEKKSYHQGWTFLGSKADWKRAVQPYYGAA